MERNGGHRDVRRERRILGPRAAAERRSLGTRHAYPGDRHLAIRETGLHRPDILRYDFDYQADHPALRSRAAGRRAHERWRSDRGVRLRRLTPRVDDVPKALSRPA